MDNEDEFVSAFPFLSLQKMDAVHRQPSHCLLPALPHSRRSMVFLLLREVSDSSLTSSRLQLECESILTTFHWQWCHLIFLFLAVVSEFAAAFSR